MKKTLTELLDGCGPEELDGLLPDEFDVSLPEGAMERIRSGAFERSFSRKRERKRLRPRAWLRAAGAACLVLALGLAGVAYAAEAKEYGEAVQFFDENGLSTDGLSREDVKAVYRDITTQRFAYEKTAWVIERSVPGVEIPQREPTPEELEALWNRNFVWNPASKTGYSYGVGYQQKLDKELGFDILDRSYLECYQDGNLDWVTQFPGLYVENGAHTSTGTAAWGHNVTWSSDQPVYSSVIRLDEAGNILWQRQLNHGFEREYIAAVVDNGDGTWAVVSRGDFEYLCLSQYDMDGNEMFNYATEVGNLGIWNVACLGDGYLVQLGNRTEGENAYLVKLDREGNITDSFTYEGEDCDYYIKDMTEFNGRVYLSAYATPKPADGESGAGGRYEIAGILNYLFDRGIWEISSEELTPMMRDNYTAVLLVCDPEGGEPETFYSVKGSLGAGLSVSEAGELIWDVESVVNTFFSPATNSFTIGGTSQVFRYAFDQAGALVRREDTGETVPYRR